MATISKPKLAIQKGKKISTVTVTYNLRFSRCELLDKTTFVETISLKGDDAWPNPDDHLRVIYSSCVNASQPLLTRKIVRRVPNKVLNEDDSIFNRGDEIYANVSLRPFKAPSSNSNSNIVKGRF